MSKISRWVFTIRTLLLLVALSFFGALLWSFIDSDSPARKLEHLSSTHYRALAWSRGGLQVQLAQHDPTTELNAWLSSLDVRNRTGDFTIDAVGFRVWNYNTDGLNVSIYHVPTWSILVVTLAMLAVSQRRQIASSAYGYRKNESKYLIVEESEAEVVREIFRLYTEEGISMNEIAYALDGKGYLRRNGARWIPGRISQTIKNPIYKAELFVNRQKAGVPVDPSEWIKIPVPPIVDPDTWEAAQKRALTNKTFAKRKVKKEYLLRGLLYCGECGSRLTAKTYLYGGRKPYSKYICYKREHKKRTGGCLLPSRPVSDFSQTANWIN